MGELENMLSSPKAPVKEVANAGLIPLVAKHLLSSDRKLAASAVHAIASITYKCSTSVMKAGCVSKLVELVCDEDGEIARNAIFALSNLAVDFQSQLLSNNALKQILWRLRQLGEPNNKKCWMLWADAMRLITNLVNITDKDDNCTKEMVKKTLKHKGDRQELIRVLKVSLSGKEQVDVVEDALRGILSLAKLHVCKHCGIPQLLDMEIIPLLTSQFSHSCYKIKKLAVDCIQDVVYNSVLDVSKCRPSPIQPLKELMHNPNQELSTCAALVLSNIACEGEQAIEALKAVGLFEAMVSLLLNPNTSTELKTEAAWFVINVCGSGARRHLEEIVELGAVHGLSRWVVKQQKDTKMVEETVAALRSVCDILLPKPEQMTRLNFPAAMAAAGISPPNSTGSPPPPGGNNGSEIKLQSMLREDEALDYVSSYVGAAKVLAHFEVSNGVYPSAIDVLRRIKNSNNAALELLEGPLEGGSRAWLARLSTAQLENILEHLTGHRMQKKSDSKGTHNAPLMLTPMGEEALNAAAAQGEAARKEKLVAMLSHAIQGQLQSKLMAHYNQVRRCEREKQLHQQHGSIHWTVDVMHPSNIKQTKLTSNPFDCGDLKCHVLLYPWGNPNRPEAHKTHLSVYVALLDIEKSAAVAGGRGKGGEDSAGTAGTGGVPGRFKLTIVNQADASKSVSKGGQHTFTELASDRGFAQMIPLKELLQVGKGFIVEGKISIKAEITLSVSQGTSIGALQSVDRPSRKQSKHKNFVSRSPLPNNLVTNSPVPPPGNVTIPGENGETWPPAGAPIVANPRLSALMGPGDYGHPEDCIIVPAADRPRHNIKLRAGLKIDCRDEFGMWLEASIVQVDPTKDRVLVHYPQWGNKWDQWKDTKPDIGRNSFANFQTCSGPRPPARVADISAGKCPNPDHNHHHHPNHHPHNPHHRSHVHHNHAVRAKPMYAEGDSVRVYKVRPPPRKWVKGTVDKVRHQQVRVRYVADGQPTQYWFHVDHGEVQKLAENVDMKDFQLTPTNEKIIREWRAQRVKQWENKGKLAQKYPTRDKLELWLDAQCLKARQQLFKKQRESAQPTNEIIAPPPRQPIVSNTTNPAPTAAPTSKSTSGKQRRRKKAKDTRDKINETHRNGAPTANATIGNPPIRPENPVNVVCKEDERDDVFADIDLSKIDFESVALESKSGSKKEAKTKRKSGKNVSQTLDLARLMASHREKAKVLKNLSEKLSELSKHIEKAMVSANFGS